MVLWIVQRFLSLTVYTYIQLLKVLKLSHIYSVYFCLGGTAFWRIAGHFLTKLPYVRGDHWVSKNVRGHGFFEIGGLGHSTSGGAISQYFGDLSNLPNRITAGIGLVIRLGPNGRAELNYCLPIKYGVQDCAMRGLQFGIGVNFS